MTGLNHVLTGAAIGLAVQEPLLVIPLALVSHFILDAIPHFDHEIYRYGSKHFTKIMLSDSILSIGAVLGLVLLFPANALGIILGALSATAPDFLWPYYYTHGRPQNWYYKFHVGIQWFERPAGAWVEASYLIFIGTVLVAITQAGVST